MPDIHGPVPQLHDYLEHAARVLGDKVALVRGAERVTFATLDRRANHFAHALVAQGLARGDRVIVFGDNTLETVIAFWAVLKANAVVSIVSPQTKTDKLAYYLKDCRAAFLVTDELLRPVWQEAAPRSPHLKGTIVGPQDPAFAGERDAPPPRRGLDVDLAAIVYTSGSTGDPKGVMLTHRNMLAAAASITSYLQMREDDIVMNVLPLAFDYGLYQVIMAARVGARVVLERSFAFTAQFLALMVDEGVTGFPGVPTIFAVLADLKNLKEYDFSRVRFVTNTAAALPEKHIRFLRELFPAARIYSMYGLTECKRCTYLPPEDLERKPGSVGIAIPNTELWIVDAEGRRVGPDTVGQLVIRGATVMRGYWEKPEATAEKLRPGPLPGEMVLYTGDYCRLDDEGYLYFVGRMDDIVKSRGEKVAPKEVEQAICEIPGVREAAVIGVPDDILGHAIKAFVVLDGGGQLTGKDIQRECQARLESFMVPKYVEIVPDLPRTATGKVRKTDLA